MSDASQREWRFYLDDIIDFAGKMLAYTDGLDQAGFVASGLTYDATRNLLIHGYLGIDDGHQWNVAPGLLRLVQSAGYVQWP